jgi:hypothetical protein
MKPIAYTWVDKEGLRHALPAEHVAHNNWPVTPLYEIPKGFKLMPIEPDPKVRGSICDCGEKNPEYYMDHLEYNHYYKMIMNETPNIVEQEK